MDRKLPETLLVGSRAWSAFGFLLVATPGSIALSAGVYAFSQNRVPSGIVYAAIGIFMMVYAFDSLIRTIRPNRLRLHDEGFTLETWRRTSRWKWHQYRGLRGVGHQLLKVERADGTVGNVPIGNWSRDVEHRFYTHASARVNLDEPAIVRPTAAWELLLSGSLVAFALLVAWLSLGR